MGRRPQAVQPWSSTKTALAECQKRLGSEVSSAALVIVRELLKRMKRRGAEGIPGTFPRNFDQASWDRAMAELRESFESASMPVGRRIATVELEHRVIYELEAEEFTATVADLLFCVERQHEKRITGTCVVLLGVAAGGPVPRNVDAFESLRKSWDEAMRRARRRMKWDGPGLSAMSAEELCESELMTRAEFDRSQVVTPEMARKRLAFDVLNELRLLGVWVQKMKARDLSKELRFLRKHRLQLRARLRDRSPD
jgi:hypothetical protein